MPKYSLTIPHATQCCLFHCSTIAVQDDQEVQDTTAPVFLSIDYSGKQEYIDPTAAITAAFLPPYMCARIPHVYACGDLARKPVETQRVPASFAWLARIIPLFWT